MVATKVSASVQALVDLIEQRELSDEQAKAMIPPLTDLLDAVCAGKQDAGRNQSSSTPVLTQLVGVVLPAKSVPIQQRVKDGQYNWKDYNINDERFFVTLDAGPADLWIAHFDTVMQTEEVEAWATAHCYEVACIEELLGVGSHLEHRKLQLQFCIIALGSSAVGGSRPFVPVLNRDGSRRGLDLDYRDVEWNKNCRFLLRKVSLPLAT